MAKEPVQGPTELPPVLPAGDVEEAPGAPVVVSDDPCVLVCVLVSVDDMVFAVDVVVAPPFGLTLMHFLFSHASPKPAQFK